MKATLAPGTSEQTIDVTNERKSLDGSFEAPRPYDGPAYTPARALLKYAGTWAGDDLEELLDEVYRTRSKVQF